MAGAIVASAAQWIGSLLIQETNVLLEVADQVESLKKELEVMQDYLIDADAKQHVREVCTLTSQIRTLAYDIEDVIDTYILKVEAKTKGQGYRDWFVNFACSVRSAPHIYQVGKQIEVIQKNMKRIREQLNSCGLRGAFESREGLRSLSYNERHSRKKPQSFPYDDYGEYIVGLDKDMSKLVEILMGEGNHQLNIVSIVGMGGSGKTTLAKKLYNHPYSKECFDCRAWVFISQEWSTKHVLSEILREVGGPNATTELNAKLSKEELVGKLRDILEKKSYLVVLDDVWKKEALAEIFPALPRANNNRGSKVIITTRNREVYEFQNLQKHLYVHNAKPLSEEDAWELFCKIALAHHTNYNTKSFENLGKEMLRKCDGLPLAIVALAGILSSKVSVVEWQRVRETLYSRVMESTGLHMSGRVGDMLALSYDDLPYDLKPCFLYLGVFPEDCLIATGMLIRMWIAEGLITARGDMSLEDVAMQHLEELSHRFMIQVVRANFKGEIKAIRLHDLLRDLCVKKAKQQSFLEVYTPIKKQPNIGGANVAIIQPRRAALHSSVSLPAHVPHLRSLVLLTRSSILHFAYVYKETVDLNVIYKSFKMLRVLNMWGIETRTLTLPSQIGSLIHLRYLGMRETNITELPMSIGNLRNLLTLDYRNIDSDDVPIKIPNVLRKLVQLRHLFLPIECPWDIEDLQLCSLENLQILWGIKLDGTNNWLSRQVPQYVKKLKILVSTQKDLDAILQCPSIIHDRLHTFYCQIAYGVTLWHRKPLCHLQHLHKLTLIGEILLDLPLLLPTNLVVLELKDNVLENVDPMVALGALAHLKVLKLSNAYQGNVFTCGSSSFPQLEELYLENLWNLDTWKIDKGAFPCLKKLEIMGCKKLEEFPEAFAFITTLKEVVVFEMPPAFSEKAIEYGWSQQRRKLPHNYEAIVKLCDSPINISSMHKLYEQFIAGVFLNNRMKKYWVIEHDGCYYNCFMVYAMGLSLATRFDGVDGVLLPGWDICRDSDWEWSKMTERDGTMIKVAKLNSKTPLLKVRGMFDIAYLSPGLTYRITYVILLDELLSGQEASVEVKLEFPDGTVQSNRIELNDKPINEWIHVSAGEFDTSLDDSGEVQFTLGCDLSHRKGFVLKGVLIEPKLQAFE